ncbi:putative nucleoredoxin 1 [Canna indica]|uniref:protein-disulfide reductase n=1 Tax=Canna indica TaxID=4628 RepID=A0AAQ3KPT3_9LILI|nr:putative nucleoredoxin 1 [Canna indica]
MPELDDAESDGGFDGHKDEAAATYDLHSLLAAEGRNFLVRNNGDQVKISDLDGNTVGLYFSASWCEPCQRFTPKLAETYNELSSRKCNFEIVYISADEDEDSYAVYFSKMPWLAIPFSDTDIRDKVDNSFDVRGIPHLVILDANRKVLTSEGVRLVEDYGSEGYPFTAERIQVLVEEEEAAKKNQTLRSLLISPSRDFVISKDKNKVPVLDLEGKIIGLYFLMSSFQPCIDFTKSLKEMYLKLKENGENFEIVLVNLDDEESSYEQGFADMPWLAIPFKDKMCDKLVRYFELDTIPTLVIIGSNGKTQHPNVVELIEDHGIEAYPFSPEKLEEIAEKEKAMIEAQTLESLLVSHERDYVIGKNGIMIPVSQLVGKNIVLYFSAHWCPPCRTFLPKLIEIYHKIKEKDSAFEIIFVSSDKDESSFNEHFSEMPWLALPFEDGRERSLMRRFKIYSILSLVAIGPTGKTITTEAKELVMAHGAAAYPFTKERRKELEEDIEETAKGWPEKIKHELHEHELVKCRRRAYACDQCNEPGSEWSFYCDDCDFDLDPKCALKYDKVMKSEDLGEAQREDCEEVRICDLHIRNDEVCDKA